MYIASLPALKLGVAIKMDSGSAPAAEVAMSAILERLGYTVPEKWRAVELRNRNDLLTGYLRAAESGFSDLSQMS